MASAMEFVVLFSWAKFNLMFPLICFAGLLNSGSETVNSCFMETQGAVAVGRSWVLIWMVQITSVKKMLRKKSMPPHQMHDRATSKAV